jgi:hypothetical protein
MGDSLMTAQEQMTDGDGNKFNMSFEDWDVIGQGTATLSTITAVVKQEEGDKYVTSSLVLPFINTCMKSRAGDGSIKQTWLAKETRGASSLCLRPMNPSNQHGKASGRTLSLGGSQI